MITSLRPLLFQNYMLQWVYNSNGGAIPWHTRLLLLASAAALAPTLAPLVLSLRVTISTSSTLALAWTAVLAQIPAPTALSFPRTNLGIHKNLVSFAYGVFCFLILAAHAFLLSSRPLRQILFSSIIRETQRVR